MGCKVLRWGLASGTKCAPTPRSASQLMGHAPSVAPPGPPLLLLTAAATQRLVLKLVSFQRATLEPTARSCQPGTDCHQTQLDDPVPEVLRAIEL